MKQPKHNMRQIWRVTKLLLFLIAGILLVGCLLYGIGIGRIQYWINPPSMKNIPAVLAQAPCVADVCIGMTGRDVVFEKLSQSGLLYGVNDSGGRSIRFSIHKGGSGWVLFADNGWKVVSGLELWVKGVSLKTVLDAFGEPDEMFLMVGCGRGFNIHARLFYREEGIEIILIYPGTRQERRERGTRIVFTERTRVDSVQYFDPAQYETWLLGTRERIRWMGYFSVHESISAEDIVDALQPWPGMGVEMKALNWCPHLD